MLDIGWTEMAFIAVIALIVIGPKDLPKAMRTVSKWVRKARSLAREFQSGLDDIARETELDEVKDQIRQSVARGVSSVPCYVINGKLNISGAQPAATLALAFDQIEKMESDT